MKTSSVGIRFLAAIVSCQKDDIFSDPDPSAENVSFFKGTEIEPGKYIGYKEECEWIVSLLVVTLHTTGDQ